MKFNYTLTSSIWLILIIAITTSGFLILNVRPDGSIDTAVLSETYSVLSLLAMNFFNVGVFFGTKWAAEKYLLEQNTSWS